MNIFKRLILTIALKIGAVLLTAPLQIAQHIFLIMAAFEVVLSTIIPGCEQPKI